MWARTSGVADASFLPASTLNSLRASSTARSPFFFTFIILQLYLVLILHNYFDLLNSPVPCLMHQGPEDPSVLEETNQHLLLPRLPEEEAEEETEEQEEAEGEAEAEWLIQVSLLFP